MDDNLKDGLHEPDDSGEGKSFQKRDSAWSWVPSLYFAEGIPFVICNVLSVIFYKRLGLSNAEIGFYTSMLYLPWVIKPLWSPFIELLGTKRFWIAAMQLLIGAAFAAMALTIRASAPVQYSLALFWLIAFSSATHDIAADGFYMLALNQKKQALFVGIRSTAYRIAMITGQGLLVMLAGRLERKMWPVSDAWSVTFAVLSGIFFLFACYHVLRLPRPSADKKTFIPVKKLFREFLNTFAEYFRKPRIGFILSFLLIYRLGEAQLAKMASPFLLDRHDLGGLQLTTESVGFIYGTVGIIALTVGGILGGVLVSRHGLKRWLWWMFLAINIPHLLYIFLAFVQPENFLLINVCVAGEQFGYGFGFTAYMIYMLHVSEGAYKTAHYAISTGFMALSMMLPGLVSGKIEELLGYKLFFIWILLTMIPGIFVLKVLRFNNYLR
jgi:PAT family beta-lactamase induction signal transducer AmpG